MTAPAMCACSTAARRCAPSSSNRADHGLAFSAPHAASGHRHAGDAGDPASEPCAVQGAGERMLSHRLQALPLRNESGSAAASSQSRRGMRTREIRPDSRALPLLHRARVSRDEGLPTMIRVAMILALLVVIPAQAAERIAGCVTVRGKWGSNYCRVCWIGYRQTSTCTNGDWETWNARPARKSGTRTKHGMRGGAGS